MATILFKTKGDASPKDKHRVYFTCHSEDFDACFERICKDIFRTHDCAIYYTPDMTESMTHEERSTEWGRIQLVVIPVTYKLLTTANRAMEKDLPFAAEANIPILPIMMEPGLDKLYSLPDKFSKRQYLNPCSGDATEIAYGQKLKKYLETVLVSDELAKRIRGAFSAYIFLSYRKKDRHHANALMRIIHSHPEYRDVAIWFDEFLIPGEDFDENIRKNLQKSKLFTLLVTPNLQENPNYVMAQEYPAACAAEHLPILPVEMVTTDLEALSREYPKVPKITDCAHPSDHEAFRRRLLEVLDRTQSGSAAEEAEHLFLVGLSYMEGIDMETDRDRGLEMITAAAEQGLPEAMHELFRRYTDGVGVPLDYREAEKWAQEILAASIEKYGEKHLKTLAALHDLAVTRIYLGKYPDAHELLQKIYDLSCELNGKENAETFAALNNLAESHRRLGDYKQARDCLEKVCDFFGRDEDSLYGLAALNNLAMTYGQLGENRKALELSKRAYAGVCRELGTEHPQTLTMQENVAMSYGQVEEFETALELLEKTLSQRRALLGEQHPATLASLSDLGKTRGKNGEYQKSLELAQRAYDLRRAKLGEQHPDTLISMNNLAMAYQRLCRYSEAAALSERECDLCCGLLGQDHPEALVSQHNLAAIYIDLGRYKEARELIQNAYNLRCGVLGEEHPDTLSALHSLAEVVQRLGDYPVALALWEKAYDLSRKRHGQKHPETFLYLEKIAQVYTDQGEDYGKADQLLRTLYTYLCDTFGQDHPRVWGVMNSRAVNYMGWGKQKDALELQEQVYTRCRDKLGEGNRLTIDALCNLSRIHCRMGNRAKDRGDMTAFRKEHDQSVRLSRRAYDLSCKYFGEEHPDTLDKLNALAVALGESGDYDKAIPMMNRAYELRKKVLGKAHLDTIESLSNLSGMQTHRGKPEKVLKKDLEVYQTCCGILGEEHPTTIRYLENLAGAYSRAGKEKEALERDKLAYAMRKKVQGADHPDTLQALNTLIGTYRHQDDCQTARELGKEALEMSKRVYGTDAPQTIDVMAAWAEDHYRSGDKSGCVKVLEELYPLCRRILGENHPHTVAVRTNLTRLHAAGGDPMKALRIIGKNGHNNQPKS